MPDIVGTPRDMMAVADPPVAALQLRVRPFDNLVLDTVRASLLRERDLEREAGSRLEQARFVLVDLNGIRSLDVQAAYELVGKFLVQVRSALSARGAPPVVAITADNIDILRTVHAALRDSRNAAYALLPDGRADPLVPMGYLTNQDIADLHRLRGAGAIPGNAGVALARLTELAKRGLLARDALGRFASPSAEDFSD